MTTYTFEQHGNKNFIGLALRTNNQESSATIPAHWDRFYKENVFEKIPHKIGGSVFALYTDYERDHTKPYSCIIGSEVSHLNLVPTGLMGKVIPAAKYAVFTSQGEFPQALIALWQEIWRSELSRSYSSDFEFYSPNFHPQNNPEVKIYIAVNDNL